MVTSAATAMRRARTSWAVCMTIGRLAHGSRPFRRGGAPRRGIDARVEDQGAEDRQAALPVGPVNGWSAREERGAAHRRRPREGTGTKEVFRDAEHHVRS